MELLGLTSVVFLIVALFGLEAIWGPDYRKTFSRLVARRQSSIVYYFVVFAIFLAAFSVFMLGWFIPHFHLPLLFIAIYLTGVAGQFACIAIPETGA